MYRSTCHERSGNGEVSIQSMLFRLEARDVCPGQKLVVSTPRVQRVQRISGSILVYSTPKSAFAVGYADCFEVSRCMDFRNVRRLFHGCEEKSRLFLIFFKTLYVHGTDPLRCYFALQWNIFIRLFLFSIHEVYAFTLRTYVFTTHTLYSRLTF